MNLFILNYPKKIETRYKTNERGNFYEIRRYYRYEFRYNSKGSEYASTRFFVRSMAGRKIRVSPGCYATAWDDTQCSRAMHQGRGHLCHYLRVHLGSCVSTCANNTRCVHTLAAREPVLSAKTSPRVFQEYVLVNLTSVTLRGSPCNFPDETAILFLLVLAFIRENKYYTYDYMQFFLKVFFKKTAQSFNLYSFSFFSKIIFGHREG